MIKPETVVFTGLEKAEYQSYVPDPRPLGPKEVIGRTLVSLISPGTELACYRGLLKNGSFPMWPGYVSVIEVETVGSEVTSVKVGDRVFCMGGHYTLRREQSEGVLPLPAGLKPEAAVFARMMGVTMATMTTTQARPPAKVLVTGLGLVGHLAAQMFQSCGYEVIAVDPSPARRAIAESKGIRNVLAAAPLTDPRWAEQIELVVECSGHEQAVLDGCRMVRKGGEVVLTGVPWRRNTDLSAHEVLYEVFHKYVVLRSGWEWELPRYATEFRRNSIYGNYEAALRWLAEGRIKVDGLHVTMSPKDAQRAYQDLMHNRCPALAIEFDWANLD